MNILGTSGTYRVFSEIYSLQFQITLPYSQKEMPGLN